MFNIAVLTLVGVLGHMNYGYPVIFWISVAYGVLLTIIGLAMLAGEVPRTITPLTPLFILAWCIEGYYFFPDASFITLFSFPIGMAFVIFTHLLSEYYLVAKQ